ncbi:MAG: class I SAM-dependent methyltransferase [Pelovirga sp.]
MRTLDDPFNRCKLCGAEDAQPRYRLNSGTVYCCPRCDFHFLDHLDGPTGEPCTTLSDSGRRYIAARIDDGRQLQQLRLQLVAGQRQLRDTLCLDIGAGLGQFVMLLRHCGATALGIEPSALRRAYAAEQFGLDLAAELVDDQVWQSRYGAAFDLVTLWDVIEHVDCPRTTLAGAVALLKPGGLLCLDTPDRDARSYRLSQLSYRLSGGTLPLFLPGFYSSLRYGHKQIFTRRQLSGLLEELGLTLTALPAAPGTRRLLRGRMMLAAVK